MITRYTGQKNKNIHSSKVVDYVASKAGWQDFTFQSIVLNFIPHIPKGKRRMKKWKKLGTDEESTLTEHTAEMRKKKQQWENGDLIPRLRAERPLHGEAGEYKDAKKGVGKTANHAAVERQTKKAAKAYNIGFYREGLLQLADALHSAEDRGAHGEGDPWTGHDPRLAMEEDWKGDANPKYMPGWDPDNMAKNSTGRAMGEKYATVVWNSFYARLHKVSKVALTLGFGAHGMLKLINPLDTLSRLAHLSRYLVAGPTKLLEMAGKAGSTVEGSGATTDNEYKRMRLIDKGGNVEEAEQDREGDVRDSMQRYGERSRRSRVRIRRDIRNIRTLLDGEYKDKPFKLETEGNHLTAMLKGRVATHEFILSTDKTKGAERTTIKALRNSLEKWISESDKNTGFKGAFRRKKATKRVAFRHEVLGTLKRYDRMLARFD